MKHALRDECGRRLNSAARGGNRFRSPVVNRPHDDLVELHFRLISDKPPELGDIRHSARHVFEIGSVGLRVRDEAYLRVAVSQGSHLCRELRNADLAIVAHVEYFADRALLSPPEP